MTSKKILIVTGGTGGLGSTVVTHLSSDYQCVLLARQPDSENVVETDLVDGASVEHAITRLVERYGEPYGLVHLAGGYAGGTVSGTTGETWQNMIGLNLTSSFLVIRETLAHMPRERPGRIVVISSEATVTQPPAAAAYVVSKSALNVLVELTAAELAGSLITSNALLPGTLDTAASRKAMPEARLIPLDRVASTIAFLLSDAAGCVNGALIRLQ